MKNYRSLCLAICATTFISCSHTITCKHPREIKYFFISGFDTASIASLRLIRYDAGTGFMIPVDSNERILTDPFNITVPADETKDYELILMPQNRRHRLSHVHFGKEKRKGSPGRDSEQCTTSVNFTYDGEQKTQPMMVGSTGAGYTYLSL